MRKVAAKPEAHRSQIRAVPQTSCNTT
jgi:hypothetical protein